MKKMRISVATFAAALVAEKRGRTIDKDFLASKEKIFKSLVQRYPKQIQGISHKYANPPDDPRLEVEVELSTEGIRRVLAPLDELVQKRLNSIQDTVLAAMREYPKSAEKIKRLLGQWMLKGEIVRVVGAGRALLAAAIPANRLAHGGASVFVLSDRSPLPNSAMGGGVIAVSASGKTQIVLDIMKLAQEVNKDRELLKQSPIAIIGFSSATASEFESLCTPGYFVGIRTEVHAKDVELRALGDLEEFALSELFDALVVAAGLELGINFRMGHEDLVGGATGPWHQH